MPSLDISTEQTSPSSRLHLSGCKESGSGQKRKLDAACSRSTSEEKNGSPEKRRAVASGDKGKESNAIAAHSEACRRASALASHPKFIVKTGPDMRKIMEDCSQSSKATIASRIQERSSRSPGQSTVNANGSVHTTPNGAAAMRHGHSYHSLSLPSSSWSSSSPSAPIAWPMMMASTTVDTMSNVSYTIDRRDGTSITLGARQGHGGRVNTFEISMEAMRDLASHTAARTAAATVSHTAGRTAAATVSQTAGRTAAATVSQTAAHTAAATIPPSLAQQSPCRPSIPFSPTRPARFFTAHERPMLPLPTAPHPASLAATTARQEQAGKTATQTCSQEFRLAPIHNPDRHRPHVPTLLPASSIGPPQSLPVQLFSGHARRAQSSATGPSTSLSFSLSPSRVRSAAAPHHVIPQTAPPTAETKTFKHTTARPFGTRGHDRSLCQQPELPCQPYGSQPPQLGSSQRKRLAKQHLTRLLGLLLGAKAQATPSSKPTSDPEDPPPSSKPTSDPEDPPPSYGQVMLRQLQAMRDHGSPSAELQSSLPEDTLSAMAAVLRQRRVRVTSEEDVAEADSVAVAGYVSGFPPLAAIAMALTDSGRRDRIDDSKPEKPLKVEAGCVAVPFTLASTEAAAQANRQIQANVWPRTASVYDPAVPVWGTGVYDPAVPVWGTGVYEPAVPVRGTGDETMARAAICDLSAMNAADNEFVEDITPYSVALSVYLYSHDSHQLSLSPPKGSSLLPLHSSAPAQSPGLSPNANGAGPFTPRVVARKLLGAVPGATGEQLDAERGQRLQVPHADLVLTQYWSGWTVSCVAVDTSAGQCLGSFSSSSCSSADGEPSLQPGHVDPEILPHSDWTLLRCGIYRHSQVAAETRVERRLVMTRVAYGAFEKQVVEERVFCLTAEAGGKPSRLAAFAVSFFVEKV